ncbi:peptidoglycan recognition protein [Streptomyces carpaticus]|uniref:peptidoglycan recognition protein family protein n=1 Tax=Streptomyces carpaticus TaxID=285558 RepID=UPI0031F7FE12
MRETTDITAAGATRRRFALAAAVLPLALLVTWDGVRGAGPQEAGGERARDAEAVTQAAIARPPGIVTRAEWGADETLRSGPTTYTGAVKAVFVHHTAHPDTYDCAEAPDLLREMYAYHVGLRGWDDLGYNFMVDKCGTIYEGRSGGLERNAYGAHTEGFNSDTVGVAVLGTYDQLEPPREVLDAIARIAAWKLRSGVDPRARTQLVSTNGDSRFAEGAAVEVEVISGHRDTSYTHCPGEALYAALPVIRTEAARLRSEAAQALAGGGAAAPDAPDTPDVPGEEAVREEPRMPSGPP